MFKMINFFFVIIFVTLKSTKIKNVIINFKYFANKETNFFLLSII